MPAELPAYTPEEISEHNTADSIWVSRAGKVYDVTEFSKIHPGGLQPLLDYGGEEVSFIMHVKESHRHTKNAYKLMEKYQIGTVKGFSEGTSHPLFDSSEAFTMDDTDSEPVDWSKPMFTQVGSLGALYGPWTHTPIDDRIRLFGSDWMESVTKCPWWVVPLTWSSVILYLLASGYKTLMKQPEVNFLGLTWTGDTWHIPFYFLFGVSIWSLVEYVIHRWLFHSSPPENSPLLITLHFLFHGQHHKAPMDPYRLVFPPVPASLFYLVLYLIFSVLIPPPLLHTMFSGGLSGYIAYDMIHYYVHHGSPPRDSYLGRVKYWHMKHHYVDYQKGFGISTRFWDYPFHTAFRSTQSSTKADKSD